MRVAGRSHAELLHACARMHGVVLPVAVTAHDEKVVRHVRLQPGTNLIALMHEGVVAVVVMLVGAIRADDWRGADQHLPRSRALFDSTLEPRLLLRTPDGLVGAVGHGVRRAVVTPVGEPHLQITPPADGAKIAVTDGCLIAENLHAFIEGEFASLHPGPGIIHERVVVILEPVGRSAARGCDQTRQAEHALPMQPCECRRHRAWRIAVIIYQIPRHDDEARIKRRH